MGTWILTEIIKQCCIRNSHHFSDASQLWDKTAWQYVLLHECQGLGALQYPVLKFGLWYYVSHIANVSSFASSSASNSFFWGRDCSSFSFRWINQRAGRGFGLAKCLGLLLRLCLPCLLPFPIDSLPLVMTNLAFLRKWKKLVLSRRTAWLEDFGRDVLWLMCSSFHRTIVLLRHSYSLL